MYVYKTTNLINSKIYIGISKKESVNSLNYLGSGKAFKRAITKYGRSNFSKEIIIEDKDLQYSDLQSLEIFLINIFDARNPKVGYNISKGGDGNDGVNNGMFGKTHSEETVNKILTTRKENAKGNPLYGKRSKETLEKLSKTIAERNRKTPTLPNGHSQESIFKMSTTLKKMASEGKLHKNHAKFTEERKLEYSEMFSGELNPFYGKEHTEETKAKIREAVRLKFPPVNKVDDEGNIVKRYDSITDVTEDGHRPDLVKKVLKGENKKHSGFYWEYVLPNK